LKEGLAIFFEILKAKIHNVTWRYTGARASAVQYPFAGTAKPSKDDSAETFRCLREALALDNDNALYHKDLGMLFLRQRMLWQAREAFCKSLAIMPNLKSAQNSLDGISREFVAAEADLKTGRVSLEAGDLESAWNCSKSSRQHVRDHPDARLMEVAVLRAKAKLDEALQTLLEVLQDVPQYMPALELLDALTANKATPTILPAALCNYRPLPIPKRPLVTVTICSFNQEKYIRDCLDSVFAQTWSPLEILIGDDGSQDKTPQIIAERVASYLGPHRIEILGHTKNLGYKGRANWLNACRRSRGRLVLQFSGDDVMNPDMVAHLVRAWQKTGASLLAVNAEYIDGDSRPRGLRLPKDRPPDSSIERLVRDGVNDSVFGAGTAYDTQMFEVFPNCLGAPPRHLGTQDIIWPFYACLLNGCVGISEPLMKYRIHGAQFSLSVAHSRAEKVEKQVLEEKMWWGHLAHALLMREALKEVVAIAPARYRELYNRLLPMLEHQTWLMAHRQAKVREHLYYNADISRLEMPKTNDK